MDVTVELGERVFTSGFGTARSVSDQELVAEVDPVAARLDFIESLQPAAALEEDLGVNRALVDVFEALPYGCLRTAFSCA